MVTWRQRPRDHLIPNFPIGGPLEPSLRSLTVSNIFIGERGNGSRDLTLNDL